MGWGGGGGEGNHLCNVIILAKSAKIFSYFFTAVNSSAAIVTGMEGWFE